MSREPAEGWDDEWELFFAAESYSFQIHELFIKFHPAERETRSSFRSTWQWEGGQKSHIDDAKIEIEVGKKDNEKWTFSNQMNNCE